VEPSGGRGTILVAIAARFAALRGGSMSTDRHARLGAASGFAYLILSTIGFAAFIGPNLPEMDAPGVEWQAYYSDHQDRIQIGIVLVSISVIFLLWFLGSLNAALRAAEGGNGRLTAVAYGGGIGVIVFFFIAMTATAVAALRPDEVDPNLTRAMNDFALLCAGPSAAAVAALFGATAIVGYRHAAVPAPVAGFSALAAVTAPLGFFVVVTDSGAFAADGFLGFLVPLVTTLIAVLALSIALFRRAPN
jgi:hypothetical protein